MTDWFDTARFGMFVHWGHSSQQGIELSWPLVGGAPVLPACTSVGVDEYHASAATFDPKHWDARALARRAAVAGMRYAVITSKHHDGYAMWHTKQSHYSVEHSPYGGDIVREFLEAVRAEGLRTGVYFSLIDWHHPDYPAFTEADKPYAFGKWLRSSPDAWERFRRSMFAQIEELLTQYGTIDLIWFDGGWERSIDEWRSRELEALVRRLQPGILINDRLPGCGDYDTPEQFVPAQPPARRWETCMTMNESWGYNVTDDRWKSSRQLIHTLCEVAGKGGNLLLNVGPRGDGSLQPEVEERLDAVTAWMSRNGESITGTMPGLEPWQFYGPSTRRDNVVYAHLLMRPYDTVTLRGVHVRRVRRVLALSTRAELPFTTRCAIIDGLINADPLGELRIDVPDDAVDPYATVLAVEFGV